MKYNGAQIIVKLLENQGIKIIAGIPGSSNLPLYDALAKSGIQHILARHEQGAGFIAQGIARSTGNVAVAITTSGPGATNIITAIADAKLDSIPIVIITGQVATSIIGTDAFQEVDTYGITIPITKHNFIAKSAKELLFLIPEAFTIASSGRPGPVVVDVPRDIQLETVDVEEWPNPGKPIDISIQNKNDGLNKIAAAINKSPRPILYAGGGIIHANASRYLISFVEKNSIPVVTTLLALGTIPHSHPLNLGMLGMHAERYTNMAMNEADLIIAVGSRFDDRATGKLSEFCPNAKVIHIDIDCAEINKNRKAEYSIVGDAKEVLIELRRLIEDNRRTPWLQEILNIKNSYPSIGIYDDPFSPYQIIRKTATLLPDDAIIATDVGQHQMWVAQAYPFEKPRTLLTSGGLGTMGFGLPVAIGASIANPKRKVVCFSGDGSILMNIQELTTAADLGCNLTIFVFKNQHLGLVRQQQELFYNNNLMASKFKTNPDFALLAKGFGIDSIDVKKDTDPKDLENALRMGVQCKKPMLINIPIHHAEKVFPMVPPGEGNTTMLWKEQ
ncbi:biosynthetic-type acetolactate synthase large subunit [Desulfoscipio sp. XC116]|uniref:biosynthetic-type acetolactate synthase large subunit n=1 Tax=Desulfoscipio sp. XC116 TaxID=3144975 RepID=UPI00325A7472